MNTPHHVVQGLFLVQGLVLGDEIPSSGIVHELLQKELCWDNLFLLLMSSRSAMSLTVRLQLNNSL